MAYRRPPRVSEYKASDEDLVSEDTDIDDVVQPNNRSLTKQLETPKTLPKPPKVVHPFATDFGPDSLQQYLRLEMEKARPRNSYYQEPQSMKLDKGKGRALLQPSERRYTERKPICVENHQGLERKLCEDDPFLDPAQTSFTSRASKMRQRRLQRRNDWTDSEDDLASTSNRSQPLRDKDLSSPTKRLARSISGMRVSPSLYVSLADASSLPDVSRPSTNPSFSRSDPYGFDQATSLRRSKRLRGSNTKDTIVQSSDPGSFQAYLEDMTSNSYPPTMVEPHASGTVEGASEVESDRRTLNSPGPAVEGQRMTTRRCKAMRDSRTIGLLEGNVVNLEKTMQQNTPTINNQQINAACLADYQPADLVQPVDDPSWLSCRSGSQDPTSFADATEDLSQQNGDDVFSCSLPKDESMSISRAITTDSIIASQEATNPPQQSFRYGQIVPERLPDEWRVRITRSDLVRPELNPSKAEERHPSTSTTRGTMSRRRTHIYANLQCQIRAESSIPAITRKSLHTPRPQSQSFPRECQVSQLPIGRRDPRPCRQSVTGFGWPDDLSTDIIAEICTYLSVDDVRNLRLVNKEYAESVAPILFRHVVAPFSRAFFGRYDAHASSRERYLPSDCMLVKYGRNIKKFAVSFEVDLNALATAKAKHVVNSQSTWWGDYKWPVANYPRFSELQELEDLVDDHHPLLKQGFQHLRGVSELGVCIDSGHGWLNGPDLSDMAVFDARCDGGSKVFGKTFRGINKWHEFGRNNLFRWAQQNTLNEAIKTIRPHHELGEDRSTDLNLLNSVQPRDRESFALAAAQDDVDPNAHCGGRPPLQLNAQHLAQAIQGNPAGLINALGAPGAGLAGAMNAGMNNLALMPQMAVGQQAGLVNLIAAQAQSFAAGRQNSTRQRTAGRHRRQQPQWPIIFNGHNIAAEFGGNFTSVREHIAPIADFPLRPGSLTEAQVQWLMETAWAQRAFLSTYTTAVIMNKANLSTVHSLCIAKLSSGLLPSLAQHEFWEALSSLKQVTIMVSPDWRREHTPGERNFSNTLSVLPVKASTSLAEFLRDYIAPIERLSRLHVGFVGGGEHAPGLCARNQNILPAPITVNPRSWVSDHHHSPASGTMIKFDHIRDLIFENCWFTPCMLRGFMDKSRDTSLRHLMLTSVSLTGVHSGRTEGLLTNAEGMLEPVHGESAWLQEQLPNDGCWPAVLDAITPGVTFLERKIAAGAISLMELGDGADHKGFRGHVQQITMRSCGYVKISGVRLEELNQHGLVVHNDNMMDAALAARKATLDGEIIEEFDEDVEQQNGATVDIWNAQTPSPPTVNQTPCTKPTRQRRTRVMMSRSSKGSTDPYFGLGTLTQAVHPIEKRVLEQAWAFTFGWGNDLERFNAVEDGWLEGGTGRFSGVISKDGFGAF